jgi:SAM-dependent methyltransferase
MKIEDSHWNNIAQFWHLVSPPLRPTQEDIILFERAVWARKETLEGSIRALVLGVTPELVSLRWPAGSILKVLDRSRKMIKTLWKGADERAMVGSWTASPVEDSSLDIIVCDGGVGLFNYPHGQLALISEVKRMLAPEGMFITRLLAPGCHTETLDHISCDLEAGRIPSLDALKFRLWGALQADVVSGVRPRDVVKNIELVAGSLQRLTDCFGWPSDHVASLEFHRTSQVVYSLTGAEEVRSLATSLSGLEVVRVDIPQHVFGDRCPIVSIRRVGK